MGEAASTTCLVSEAGEAARSPGRIRSRPNILSLGCSASLVFRGTVRLNPVLVWLYRAPLGNSPRGNLNEGKYGKSRRSQGNLSHNGGLSQLSGQVHVLCSSASAGALPTCYGALIIVQHVCGRRMLNIVICSGRFFSPLPIKVFCRQRINPDSPIGTFRPYGASRRASRAGWTTAQ